MNKSTLLLVLSLFVLHATNRCWAQEPTSATDTLEFMSIISSSDNIMTDGATIGDLSDSMTVSMHESPAAAPEAPSDSISSSSALFLAPELPSLCPNLEPPPIDPNSEQISSDFIATIDQDIIKECSTVTITWSGTGITPPYLLFYSKGTGEIGDSSILGEEICLSWEPTEFFWWVTPPNSKTPPGNVTRITIMEDDGRGQTTTLWVPWDATGHRKKCDIFLSIGAPEIPPSITRKPFNEIISPTQLDMIDHTEGVPSPTEGAGVSTFEATTRIQALSNAPVPMPTPTPTPIQIAPPIPGRVASNIPGIAPVANNRPNPIPHLPRPSGANGPSRDVGNTVRPSAPAEGTTSQDSNGEGDKPGDGLILTLVSVGASTTLTVVTEVPLGTGPIRNNTRISETSEMQPYVGPAMPPTHGQSNTPTHSGLPPAAVGTIVGTLLGALILWILLVIWLKKIKKSRGFKELEEVTPNNPSVERNGITPFVPPAPELRNPINPDSKRRFMQEVPRPISPVTSIGDSLVHSEFYTMPITESLSEDPYSVASSSDPFKRLSASHKDPQGVH